MSEGDTVLNAVIGAAATVMLAGALPVSPLVGGLFAGYLEGGSRDDGLKVGAISGVIALFPFILLAIVASNLLLFAVGGLGIPGAMGGLGFVAILFALLFGLVYIVGLSAVGGWLGNYVKYDTGIAP